MRRERPRPSARGSPRAPADQARGRGRKIPCLTADPQGHDPERAENHLSSLAPLHDLSPREGCREEGVRRSLQSAFSALGKRKSRIQKDGKVPPPFGPHPTPCLQPSPPIMTGRSGCGRAYPATAKRCLVLPGTAVDESWQAQGRLFPPRSPPPVPAILPGCLRHSRASKARRGAALHPPRPKGAGLRRTGPCGGLPTGPALATAGKCRPAR